MRLRIYGSVMNLRIRLAEVRDIPVLRELIEASVRGLQAADYSAAQLESALRTVYGVDTQLISDGTYFVVEETGSARAALLVGCGGWSRRRTLYGGDQWAGREDSLLDPAEDAAKIRAFFGHPAWARRGVGGASFGALGAGGGAAGVRGAGEGAGCQGRPCLLRGGGLEAAGQ